VSSIAGNRCVIIFSVVDYAGLHTRSYDMYFCWIFPLKKGEEEEIYICSSRLGLIKMDHHHSGNGRNSQQ
jgi:hypothetical protein